MRLLTPQAEEAEEDVQCTMQSRWASVGIRGYGRLNASVAKKACHASVECRPPSHPIAVGRMRRACGVHPNRT